MATCERLVGARHGKAAEKGGDESACEARGFVTEKTLREIDEEDLTIVHDGTEVETERNLTKGFSQIRLGYELTDLILKRRNGVLLLAGFPAREFVLPNGTNEGIPAGLEKGVPVFGIIEKTREAEEAGVWRIEKNAQCVVEKVFETGPPTVFPNVFKSGEKGGGDEWSLFGRNSVGDKIEGWGKLGMSEVEGDEVVLSMGRQASGEFLTEVAVGIDEADSVTLLCEREKELE